VSGPMSRDIPDKARHVGLSSTAHLSFPTLSAAHGS
jgi:hypothetical protein